MPSVAGSIRVSVDFIDHRVLNEFAGFDAITIGQLIHFVMSKMVVSLRNMLGITDPDIPLFRTFRLRYLLQMFRERTLTMVTPGLWDDPFENFITGCVINYSKDGIWHQDPLDRVRKPVYGQCWSRAAESDALWRIYSTVIRDPVTERNTSINEEGVKLRTTARKLLTALWSASPSPPEDACFLGQVVYMEQELAAQTVANEVGRYQLGAFSGGLGHAKSLLIKRAPFHHEQEVRLVFVENRDGYGSSSLFTIPIDPNSVFDEITLDPRLHAEDAGEREAELRSLGFTGSITKSNLYQKVLFEIMLK